MGVPAALRLVVLVCVLLQLLAATWASAQVARRQSSDPPAPAPEPKDPKEPKSVARDSSVVDAITDWLSDNRGRLDRLFEGGHKVRGVYPLGGVVVASSGLAAGVGYRDERLVGSPFGFDASTMFSLRGYETYRLQVGLLGSRRTTLSLAPADAKAVSMFNDHSLKQRGASVYADFRYRDYPQHPFYGIGPDTIKQHRSDYLLFGSSYDAVVQYQFTPRVGVAGRVGLLDLGIGPGQDAEHPNVEGSFSLQAVPGLAAQPRFATFGFAAALDLRTTPPDPRDGLFIGGAIWRFDERNGSAFDFTRTVVDLRSYFTPITERGVLALRTVLAFDSPSGKGHVPFFLQQTLGGGETLRGFSSYRFRDDAIFYAGVEYRWRINDFVDAGPFVDSGGTAPRLSRLSLDKLEWTFGWRAGARYRSRALFHVDWGFSREGQRLTAGTGVLF